MRHFWKQLAYAAIAKLIVADRERIIKLLEDYSDGELLVIPTGQISALIKGEQK